MSLRKHGFWDIVILAGLGETDQPKIVSRPSGLARPASSGKTPLGRWDNEIGHVKPEQQELGVDIAFQQFDGQLGI